MKVTQRNVLAVVCVIGACGLGFDRFVLGTGAKVAAESAAVAEYAVPSETPAMVVPVAIAEAPAVTTTLSSRLATLAASENTTATADRDAFANLQVVDAQAVADVTPAE